MGLEVLRSDAGEAITTRGRRSAETPTTMASTMLELHATPYVEARVRVAAAVELAMASGLREGAKRVWCRLPAVRLVCVVRGQGRIIAPVSSEKIWDRSIFSRLPAASTATLARQQLDRTQ